MIVPTSIGGAGNIGMVTPDYTGSYDEWFDTAVGTLLREYKTGAGGQGWADANFTSPYGRPDPADYGDERRLTSLNTVRFIENYVKNEGTRSPAIQELVGSPPDRRATYVNDPNSASSIYGSFADKAKESALDRAAEREKWQGQEAGANARAEMSAAVEREGIASRERVAGMQEAGATQRTTMQIDASWREATLADATRRYVAEGDWGTQKWVVEKQEAGSLQRLQLQLAFNREALAQDAIAEKNRHQESLIGLALEVAKYDAELAGNPANLYAYAAWLKNRNVVVNGMTVAMAAQEVPLNAIDPAEVAGAGDMVGALTQQQALVSGQSGGSQQQVTPEQLQQIIQSTSGAPAGTTAQLLAGGAVPQQQTSPSAEQLGQTSDPAALANQLLGLNPVAPNAADVSQPNLQALASGLNVAGTAPTAAGFGAYGGPRTNALGVEIPQVSGQEVDYRKFAALLPTEQQNLLGGVKSVRSSAGMTDFAKELELSRPKGRVAGAFSFG